MTLGEVAAYLKIGEKTVHRMIGRNEIPCAKVGGQWRFFRPMIDDWLVSKMSGYPRSAAPEVADSTDSRCPVAGEHIKARLDIPAGPKDRVLRALIEPLEGILPNPRNFLALLLERERMLSTAVGNGVAFPHLRYPQANPRGGPYLVVGVSPEGVEFGAPDDRRVYLFALYCAHDETTHLRGLSALSVLFDEPETVRILIAARSREDVVAALT